MSNPETPADGTGLITSTKQNKNPHSKNMQTKNIQIQVVSTPGSSREDRPAHDLSIYISPNLQDSRKLNLPNTIA